MNSALAVITPVGRESKTISDFVIQVQSQLNASDMHFLVTDDYTDEASLSIIQELSKNSEYLITLVNLQDDSDEKEPVSKEEKQPRKSEKTLLNKKKGNIITSIYSRGLITRNVKLAITNIGKNIKETLEKSIAFNYEGKCLVEGFVKPNSSKIITYSSGLIERGNQISFEIVFECDICFPVEGTKINCVAKNITKAGIRAESAFDVPSPIVVFIARDHHYNMAEFAAVKEDDKFTVRVIGQRFELNDKFISIIGELVKEKPDYRKFKKPEAKAKLVFEE
jgi:DNA-directed RNA polymerase subunit E'/Rpb7